MPEDIKQLHRHPVMAIPNLLAEYQLMVCRRCVSIQSRLLARQHVLLAGDFYAILYKHHFTSAH